MAAANPGDASAIESAGSSASVGCIGGLMSGSSFLDMSRSADGADADAQTEPPPAARAARKTMKSKVAATVASSSTPVAKDSGEQGTRAEGAVVAKRSGPGRPQ